MKRKEEIKDFYEKFAQNLIRDKINPNPRHQKIISYLKNLFQKYNFKNALEIGCGIGIISEFISKHISEVTGIDISGENIKFAKATVKKVNFHCSDFLEFPVKEKFDLITLFDVLEHLPKETHKNVFKRINEISKPNTIIIITIPDPYFLSHIRKYNPEKLQVVDESIYLSEMIPIFNENNLEVLKFEKYGIDYDNQYNIYLLGYRKGQYILEKPFTGSRNIIIKIYSKILNQVRRLTGKIRYGKYLKH